MKTLDFQKVEDQVIDFEMLDQHLKIRLYWNCAYGGFYFDLWSLSPAESDIEESKIIMGAPLIIGAPALLSSNTTFVITAADMSGNKIEAINFDEIGDRIQLVFMTKDEYVNSL